MHYIFCHYEISFYCSLPGIEVATELLMNSVSIIMVTYIISME